MNFAESDGVTVEALPTLSLEARREGVCALVETCLNGHDVAVHFALR